MSGILPELSEGQLRELLPLIAWRRETKLAFPGLEFEEKYPEDWKTAFVVSGKSYFDRDILIQRDRELVGYRPLQTFSGGQAKIFHKRIPGRRYVAGVDVATGRIANNDDPDYCAAVFLDLETGEEVGSYRARVTPEECAYDIADMGRYFNDAIVFVERTGDGGTCVLVLQGECRYGGVGKFKEWMKRERKIVEYEGFPTTVRTRPVALNMLNRMVKEHPEFIWDQQFIAEALSFVRNDKGKPEAATGAHDDTVSARWIAHACRNMMLSYWQPWLPSAAQGLSSSYQSADRL